MVISNVAAKRAAAPIQLAYTRYIIELAE